jgi:hypothetical protein
MNKQQALSAVIRLAAEDAHKDAGQFNGHSVLGAGGIGLDQTEIDIHLRKELNDVIGLVGGTGRIQTGELSEQTACDAAADLMLEKINQ